MSNIFIFIYNYFQRYKSLLYASLAVIVAIMAYFSTQLQFEENVSSFFPDTQKNENFNKVFKNLKIKDKIFVMFFMNDLETDPEMMIEVAEKFKTNLEAQGGGEYFKSALLHIDESLLNETQNIIYTHLPIFLLDDDYRRIDSLLSQGGIEAVMKRNYSNLLSPAGGMVKEYILKDPLSLGGNSLKRLQDFQLDSGFEYSDGYLFSKDASTLLMLLTPRFDIGSTGENEKLISLLEDNRMLIKDASPQINIQFYGGPTVSVYNARQIKNDALLTSIIALVIIILFISLVFKKKSTIPLIVSPVLFGGLFAICMIYLIKGSISAIAVGSGSIILGVSLSYSIHMVVHQKHVTSVIQLIKEITYPLTVGSFTTIGAFLGLLFTSSGLLRDFGLFASLTLLGTTSFCLIYLPHFLSGEAHEERGLLLKYIEKFNSYRFDENKWLVGGFFLLVLICSVTSRWVGFDADMMKINYEPDDIKEASQRLVSITEEVTPTVLLVSVGENETEAIENYNALNQKLRDLQEDNLIGEFASANYFFVTREKQRERIEKWNNYWTSSKINDLKTRIEKQAAQYHFKAGAFNAFFNWLETDFVELDYDKAEYSLLFDNWEEKAGDFRMLITQVKLPSEEKVNLYSYFNKEDDVVVFDRSYFTQKWVSALNDDFYLVLFISSILIFVTLLISYGRIELTLISFAPMFFSWIIIIGIMGILGMEFNIINIILSTFIFGIGDDFSIFVTDGLQNKYRSGKKVLNGHKTAIFFSAFTIIVGMGALIFARHPALFSISTMSILGMIVVVLGSYIVSPFLFKLFILSQTEKGFPPYTFLSLLSTLAIYLTFLIGSLFLSLIVLFLPLCPIPKAKKQTFVCYLIMYACRFVCKISYMVKLKKIGYSTTIFDKPGIIIANHQSFTDILFLLSLSPKVLMVTNKWVWSSPFFGTLIRYAGYFHVHDGYEHNLEAIKQKIDEGYSIIIFPEGTRSEDLKIKRFHSGAFYLASKLKIDIIPVVLYGSGMVVSKKQPFYVKKGWVVIKFLPIIQSEAIPSLYYRETSKKVRRYFIEEYDKLYKQYNTPSNPYFYSALVKNYLYKGPIEEWYIRIKVKMERTYLVFNDMIPSKAHVTDIGCGYGMLSFALTLFSDKRTVYGIDYDMDKIEVANHSYLRNKRTVFQCADATKIDLPFSDVFVLNDVLHYMERKEQNNLIRKCYSALNPDGCIIIREGDSQKIKEQKLTGLTEFFSTKVFKFNKTSGELHFTSAKQLKAIADECGMRMDSFKNDKYTSNTIFIFKKEQKMYEEI